jgi:hypothetical protein
LKVGGKVIATCFHTSVSFSPLWGEVEPSSEVTYWPIVPAPDDDDDDDDDDDERAAIGGMIFRGRRSTRRKSALIPLCLPQSPHDLTQAGTRAAAVGSLSYGTATLLSFTAYLNLKMEEKRSSEMSNPTRS